MRIDDKYNLEKKKKPETKAEVLEQKIQELVKKRDAEKDPNAKAELHAQVLRLFAQYEGLRL